MSNVFQEVGHGLKVAAVDTEHAVIKAVDFLPHAAEVLATAIKDEPEVKTLVTQLVEQATSVLTAGTAAVTYKGIDLVADAATLAAAESFFAWIKSTFIPEVEVIYTQIKVDVASS